MEKKTSKRQQENLDRVSKAALKYLQWRQAYYEEQSKAKKKRWLFWR